MKKKPQRQFMARLTASQLQKQQEKKNEELDARLKALIQATCEAAIKMYTESNEEKPTPRMMVTFLLVTLVASEVKKTGQDVMSHINEYADELNGMYTILNIQFAFLGAQLPKGFPYTVQELTESMREQGQ